MFDRLDLAGAEAAERLAAWIAECRPELGLSAESISVRRLLGGSVQENWLVEGNSVARPCRWVLRADPATKLPASRSKPEEFALLRAARDAGVACPVPLLLEKTGSVLGRPFFLMEHVPGNADPDVATMLGEADGLALAEALGLQLGLLHRLRPASPRLAASQPVTSKSERALALYRSWLDRLGEPHPVLEWALRRLTCTMPTAQAVVLCHGDFRTGNYLQDAGRLTAILDWEFAGWGDPGEDLGWFCSATWRFRRPDRIAGGLAPLSPFIAAYEQASGIAIDGPALRWWEAAASLRWALIAFQQCNRLLRDGESSPGLALDLALTGHRPAECEAELLRLLGAR